MYVLLIPPVAVAVTLLCILARRVFGSRTHPLDTVEEHRRCLAALDPRAAAAAERAAAEPAKARPLRRHA